MEPATKGKENQDDLDPAKGVLVSAIVSVILWMAIVFAVKPCLSHFGL